MCSQFVVPFVYCMVSRRYQNALQSKDENAPDLIVSDIIRNNTKNILLDETQKKKVRIIKCSNEKSSIVLNTIKLEEDEIILIDGSPHKESLTKYRSPKTSKFSIDVKSWVAEHHLGPLLITQLESGSCDVKHRKLLVRIVCARMMKLYGSAYPPAEFKEEVAKDIVRAFPGLRSKSYAQGHETFYDKSSGLGFLEFRLKTVRKSLNPSEKRRMPSRQKSASQPRLPRQKLSFFADEDLLDSETLEKKVLWMQKQKPTESNKQAIHKALQETMANRQKEIKDSNMTITDVFTRYPRLRDYNGEMIDCEFATLYPNYSAFLGVFESFYVPRLMQYIETNRPDLLDMVADINDNALKAVVLLPELLPSPNYRGIKSKKGRIKSNEMKSYTFNKKIVPNPELLMLLNEKENPDTASKEDASCMQPFLICTISEQKKIKQSFLQSGNLLIAKHENHPLKAFDLLFKMHHVFNVPYAPQLRNFYDFIGGCIYKIYLPRACTDALNTIICNMAVDLNRIL